MRWPGGVWLFACSIASPVWSQQAALPDAPAPASDSAAAGAGLRWQLPQVMWGGSLAYDMRLDRYGNEPYGTQHLLTATLDALTYVYQPWLALVGGSLSLTRGRSGGGPEALTEDDQFVTGTLRAGVFPRSRFPLELRYQVSDSRTDSSLGGGIDYRSRDFALTQRFRPAAGEFELSATYERRSQEGMSFGEDTQESMLADFSTRWKRNNLSASLSRSLNRRKQTDEETDFLTTVVRHSYLAGTELTVETNANWAKSDERLFFASNVTNLAQWSTVALWRPGDQRLMVTGTLRGYAFDSAQQDPTKTVGVGVGASYDLSRNLRLNATANITRSNESAATAKVGTLGASYQADSLSLGAASYNWYSSIALSRASSRGLLDDAVSGQLGHALSRVWPLASGSNITASLNQTLSATYTAGDVDLPGHPLGLSKALTQMAGLTWASTAANQSAFARVSISDSRQLDAEEARFQLVNLQLSGTHEVDRWRGWSGDLTLQRVQQRSLASSAVPHDPFDNRGQITDTASGEITWRQQRFFGEPRLRFLSRLRLSRDALHRSDGLVPVTEREEMSWENRLDYQIGRLETSAIVRIARVGDVWHEFLLFRVQRSF